MLITSETLLQLQWHILNKLRTIHTISYQMQHTLKECTPLMTNVPSAISQTDLLTRHMVWGIYTPTSGIQVRQYGFEFIQSIGTTSGFIIMLIANDKLEQNRSKNMDVSRFSSCKKSFCYPASEVHVGERMPASSLFHFYLFPPSDGSQIYE